jgi:hypothetical protein
MMSLCFQVCGRLKVQITRALEDGGKEADAGSLSDDENPDLMDSSEPEEQLGITDHDEEISVGQTIAVKVGRAVYGLWGFS